MPFVTPSSWELLSAAVQFGKYEPAHQNLESNYENPGFNGIVYKKFWTYINMENIKI